MCALDEASLKKVDEMLPQFLKALTSGKVSAFGRDNIMELLTKFITCKDGVGWSKKFIAAHGKNVLGLIFFKLMSVVPFNTSSVH